MITDMILGSESTEAFLRACANKADLEESTAPMNGFKAKLLASEIAVEVANKAIQVMGAHGYSRDYIVDIIPGCSWFDPSLQDIGMAPSRHSQIGSGALGF